ISTFMVKFSRISFDGHYRSKFVVKLPESQPFGTAQRWAKIYDLSLTADRLGILDRHYGNLKAATHVPEENVDIQRITRLPGTSAVRKCALNNKLVS
ncbi:MAG TPA: hypothetical protein VLM90_03920, partial [Candidatus Deferrimicrobium sp.]|nr:hypothetical protein [Candidatus Deferrimicrobium sp.]